MAKARRRVRDTWKEKVWYEVLAPGEFKEASLGTSPAKDWKARQIQTIQSAY